jgi:LCP family protein required for cell wall assembly
MTISSQPFQPRRSPRPTSLTTYAPGAAFIGTKAPVHAHRPGAQRGFTRRHPFWSLAVIFLIIGVSGLTMVLTQALSTVSALHSVSTPPPSISMPAVSLDDQPLAWSALEASPVASPEAFASASDTDPSLSTPMPSALVDTSIARTQVEAAGGSYDDSTSVVSSIISGASDVSGLAEGVGAAAGTTSTADLAPITILLMGVDAREGDAIDVGVNSDVLAVAHLDPESGSCRMLNIPRDSRVDLPGYGLTKINHALAVGGIPYQQLVVEQFLGITIDNYALIDFNGIISLVDSFGGVEVEITESFFLLGTQFDPGVRTLTGLEALRYSRFRGGADGDFGRIRRQQQVLKALIETAAGSDPATLVRSVLPVIDNHVRTDLEPVEMVNLGKSFRTRCTEETLETMTLSGTIGTFWDPLYSVNLSYVVIDEADKARKVAELIK